ncbi:beta-galactosidase [Candidatus Sumerlaeota bacterium]|nr:beta-galactosidase [Candidatus Sumerlaeota bacterium]
MDALSLHPYCYPRTPEAADIWGQMEEARALTAEFGEPLDVWVTEIGYPTNLGGGVTERYQSSMIARTYIRSLTVPWIRTWFWYWFGPDGPDRTYNEDNFGIVREDWSTKPAYDSLRTVISQLASAEFERSLDVAEGMEAHVFTLAEGEEHSHVTALWAWEEVRHAVVETEALATLVTLDGEETTLHPHEGRIVLDLVGEPMLLLTQGIPTVHEPEEASVFLDMGEHVMTSSAPHSLVVWRRGLFDLSVDWPDDPHFLFESGTESVPGTDGLTGEVYHLRPSPDAPREELPLWALLTDAEGRHVGRIQTSVRAVEAAEISLSPLPPREGRTRRFLCEVHNRTPQTARGEVVITPSEGVEIRPVRIDLGELGANARLCVPVEILSDHSPDTVFFFDASVHLETGEIVSAPCHLSFLTSRRTEREIVIDGDLSDWAWSDPIHLGSQDQINHQGYPWDGSEDASARVWTAWDDEWFHVAAEVTDDLISDPCAGFSVYKNDGLEIYFDADHWGDRREDHHSDDDNQYGMFMEQGRAVVYAWTHLGDHSPGGRVEINRAPSADQTLSGEGCTYIIEGSIPLSEIGVEPRDGHQIGFSVALTDDDTPDTVHPFGQDLQMSWTGLRHAWQNPHQFADLFFVDPAAQGHVTTDGPHTLVDGDPFIPFGFWTYGFNEESCALLAEHHITALATDFNWNRAEPEPDVFDEEALLDFETRLDLAWKYGMRYIVQPGLHNVPSWIYDRYPDVRMQTPDGTPGSANFGDCCPNHGGFRQEVEEFLQVLAERIGDHPALLGWSLWNEPALRRDVDYHPLTVGLFRDWLAERFTLEELSERWGMEFADWSEVEPPDPEPQSGTRWNDWMTFRTENFAEFFVWEADLLRSLDPHHPVTVKAIWAPADSTVAWEFGTRHDLWSGISDVFAMDPYPHPFENFSNRWLADWCRSAAPDRPRWILEYNRAFAHDLGVTSPAEVRTWTWQSLGRGVEGFWWFFWPMNPYDPQRGDDLLAFRHPTTLEPTAACEEIFRLAEEIERLTPVIAQCSDPHARIAVLGSRSTYLQHAGERFATANETAFAELMQMISEPVRFVTEEEVEAGLSPQIEVLAVTGALCVSDATLHAIGRFADRGGLVITCARFAEEDELGRPRTGPLPEWMAIDMRRGEMRRLPESEPRVIRTTGLRCDGTEFPLEVSWPQRLREEVRTAGSSVLWPGPVIGFQDMAVSQGWIERARLREGAEVLAWRGSEPAVARLGPSLHVLQDLSWVSPQLALALREWIFPGGESSALRLSGPDGEEPLPHADAVLRPVESGGLLFVTVTDMLAQWGAPPGQVTVQVPEGMTLDTQPLVGEGESPTLDTAVGGAWVFQIN